MATFIVVIVQLDIFSPTVQALFVMENAAQMVFAPYSVTQSMSVTVTTDILVQIVSLDRVMP